MRPDKRSLIVIGMLLVIVAFITIYAMMIMGDETIDTQKLEDPQVPELKEESKEYESRLEAVDGLTEEKPLSLPGLYDDDLIDAQGQYDPYLEEKEKAVLMDSILRSGPDLEDYQYEVPESTIVNTPDDTLLSISSQLSERKIGQGHASFFLAHTGPGEPEIAHPDSLIRVEVNGDQVVRKDERLELRLMDPIVIQGDSIPGNMLLYGFCSFQPNRLLLKIPQIGNKAIQLEAYDISDGQKGIYIENSFRSQAATEVIDDVIQDINVSGIPQVSGLKGIFQRSNRSVKVKVLHQYQLYLKPVL